MRSDPDLVTRLRALTRHRDAMAEPGFSFGHWVPSREDADGVIHLPWYEPSPAGEAFLGDVRGAGWVVPSDWPTWLATPEAQALVKDPAHIAGASVDDLSRLLTAIVRSDRFNEGSLVGAFESGLIGAILDRADALATELEGSGRD